MESLTNSENILKAMGITLLPDTSDISFFGYGGGGATYRIQMVTTGQSMNHPLN
jgi:hypothetical protein